MILFPQIRSIGCSVAITSEIDRTCVGKLAAACPTEASQLRNPLELNAEGQILSDSGNEIFSRKVEMLLPIGRYGNTVKAFLIIIAGKHTFQWASPGADATRLFLLVQSCFFSLKTMRGVVIMGAKLSTV